MTPIPHLASQLTHSVKSNFARMCIPFSKSHLNIAQILYAQGMIASWSHGDASGPHQTPISLTPNNVHARKLWLTLKYRQGSPALSKMEIVSKPSRRVYASFEELQALASARKVSSLIKKQVLGQVTLLETPYGVLELKEALEKRVGGEVLAIVY